jgi:hypothetical protein
MEYRFTWRHEVIINANSPEDAKAQWDAIDLGKLDKELADGEISFHHHVENVSAEDGDFNDI